MRMTYGRIYVIFTEWAEKGMLKNVDIEKVDWRFCPNEVDKHIFKVFEETLPPNGSNWSREEEFKKVADKARETGWIFGPHAYTIYLAKLAQLEGQNECANLCEDGKPAATVAG